MPFTVGEMIHRVEQDGWRCVRQTGSHRQFHHPVKRGTVTIAGKLSIELPAEDPEKHLAASAA